MSKILTVIKNILLAVLIYFLIKSFIVYGLYSIILPFILALFIVIHIKDLFIKKEDDKYNILLILTLVIVNFVFIRVFYDPGFLSNANITDTYAHTYLSSIDDLKYSLREQDIIYLTQNTIFFTILFILLLVYRALNLTKEKKNNKKINIAMMITSIISVLPSIYLFIYYFFIDKYGFYSDVIVIYLLFMVIIFGINLYRLIAGRYKEDKRIFIITIILNIITLLSIYLNLAYPLSMLK